MKHLVSYPPPPLLLSQSVVNIIPAISLFSIVKVSIALYTMVYFSVATEGYHEAIKPSKESSPVYTRKESTNRVIKFATVSNPIFGSYITGILIIYCTKGKFMNYFAQLFLDLSSCFCTLF